MPANPLPRGPRPSGHTERIEVRLTPAQRRQLEALCARRNESASEYLRSCIERDSTSAD